MIDDARSEMLTVFHYRPLRQHAKAVMREWRSLLLTASVVFATLWGLAEATSYFLEVSFRGWVFFATAVAVSLLAGSARAAYAYVHACPKGFEHESREARGIAQLQKPLWEYRLARQLLNDKLTGLDRELDDLLENRVLVPTTRHIGVEEFAAWATLRISTLVRMAEVAQRLLITDFPGAIKALPEHPADAVQILTVVDQIRSLYSETVAYERETRATEPVEVLAGAHRLMLGWSAPIRSGIQQLNGFLEKILALDPHTNHRVEYTIVFPDLPNQKELDAELERVLTRLQTGSE
jgi:hypothetical protein